MAAHPPRQSGPAPLSATPRHAALRHARPRYATLRQPAVARSIHRLHTAGEARAAPGQGTARHGAARHGTARHGPAQSPHCHVAAALRWRAPVRCTSHVTVSRRYRTVTLSQLLEAPDTFCSRTHLVCAASNLPAWPGLARRAAQRHTHPPAPPAPYWRWPEFHSIVDHPSHCNVLR